MRLNDTVTATSVFNDYAGAKESNRRVLAFRLTERCGNRASANGFHSAATPCARVISG